MRSRWWHGFLVMGTSGGAGWNCQARLWRKQTKINKQTNGPNLSLHYRTVITRPLSSWQKLDVEHHYENGFDVLVYQQRLGSRADGYQLMFALRRLLICACTLDLITDTAARPISWPASPMTTAGFWYLDLRKRPQSHLWVYQNHLDVR